jgi:hypothetical protein
MTMQGLDDDEADYLLTLNLRQCCDGLLADLMQAERLPANMPDANVDRYPRLYPAVVPPGVWASTAQMCAAIGEPAREPYGPRR